MSSLSQLSLFGIIMLTLIMNAAVCSTKFQEEGKQTIHSSRNSSHLSETNLCAELPDGAYPDYNQACRMFFICSGGLKAATFWCTKGFVFSFTSGHCEPPDRARCPDPNNPPILNNVFQLQMSATSNECQLGDGVYPNFSDGCSSFYFCKGGIKSSFTCPQSLKFDWRTKSCRNSKNVICGPLSCEDKEDGTYIDANSYCRRYFECHSGNITQYVCPDGTIYNARQHRCTRSSTTRCHGLESAQCAGLPDGYYPDFSADCKIFGLCMAGGLKTFNCPANTLFDIKTLTCEREAYCPKPEINKCLGKPNGIHPDFTTECRDFFMCLDELLTHQGSCPQGKLLNPKNGECQPSSLVFCSEALDTYCSELPDGTYPDYDTGCSAYFVCLGGKRISTSYCSETNLYDISSGRCLPSSFVLCRPQISMSPPPRLFDSYNCDNRMGIFPEFSSDCQRYATCAYGHKQYFMCPENYSFDPESNSCQRNNKNCKAPFAVATFQCLPGDDGVYVGPNCSQWHECRNGIGFTNVCPQGMSYHAISGKCAISNLVCQKNYIIQKRLFRSSEIVVLSNSETRYECPQRTIALFSDSSSCRKFHFCVDGMRASYSCPLNFSFQKSQNKCGWNDGNAECPYIQPKPVINHQTTFSCAYLDDGMYADFNSNCRKYFVCEKGESIPVYCPEKQKFSTVKMICEREEFVVCSPHRQRVADRTLNRSPKQSDEIYHVYRPDELYTESYSYLNERNNPPTKIPNNKDSSWYDYDDVSEYIGDNISSSTDFNEEPDRIKAPNSIHNNAKEKRLHPVKYNPSLQDTTSNKLNGLTTLSYEDKPKSYNNSNTDTEKSITVKIQSRDFDAACRKGDTGFFPDYESGCKMFHICFRSIKKTYSCPSVLLFNPETKNCDLPENVVCTRPQPMTQTYFDCKKKMNEFLPDYESGCKYYIGCMNNLPYKFECPRGKVFSIETSSCESENSYKCEYPQESNSTLYDFTQDDERRAPSFRHVHGVPGQFYFSCSDKRDGFYPDYTRHCHVFYRCVRGKKFSHYCKQGLLFNPETGICDFEENVSCLSGNRTVSNF